jgi:hypothetical protein
VAGRGNPCACVVAAMDRFVPRDDGGGAMTAVGCDDGRRVRGRPGFVIARRAAPWQSMSLCDGRNSHLQLVDLCGFSLENAREARGEK